MSKFLQAYGKRLKVEADAKRTAEQAVRLAEARVVLEQRERDALAERPNVVLQTARLLRRGFHETYCSRAPDVIADARALIAQWEARGLPVVGEILDPDSPYARGVDATTGDRRTEAG